MTEKWPIMRSTRRNEAITVSGVTGTVPPDGPRNYPQGTPQDPTGGWHQPAAYYTQPFNAPAPVQPRRGMSTGAILAIVFGSIAALCVLAGIGVALVPTPKEKPAADGNAGTPAPYDTTQPTAAATSAATTRPTSPPAGPLTSFGDGTHEVGTGAGQIPPGTYTATVPDQAFDLCYWARLKGFSGEGKDTIAFGAGNKGDKQRVTIAPTDKGFETKGCGTWSKA